MKKKYNGAGVYGLYNVIENKIYIGLSKHIQNRFSQHRMAFRDQSNAAPMYQEPMENFAFVILHKLSNEDFERFGDFVEDLYIIWAKESKVEVYNRQKVYDDISTLLVYHFDMDKNFSRAINEGCGRKPWDVRKMKPESRKALRDAMQAS